MPRARNAVLCVVVLALGGPCFGQRFNIDLDSGPPPGGGGNPAQGGPPASYGGAAGQPGSWNEVLDNGDGGNLLLDVNGGATAVVMALNTDLATLGSNPESQYFGGSPADAQLLADGKAPGGAKGAIPDPVEITFTGLLDGPYAVYTYGGGDTERERIDVTVQATIQSVGGAYEGPGFFQIGVTHTVHQLVVRDGTLTVAVSQNAAAPGNGFVSGLQLVFAPDACVADVNDDGNVDVDDLIAVILQWGGGGEADVNGDDVVDDVDLAWVIALWGSCDA